MARHEIRMKVPSHHVVNSDVTIEVRSDDALLGRIEISKGSIDWWPSKNSRNHFKMTWENFQSLMEAHGKQVSK